MSANPFTGSEAAVQRIDVWRLWVVVLSAGVALAASSAAAQDVAGLTFDVTVSTGDSAAAVTQTGSGWIAGRRSRMDLRGPANPAEAMPGMRGQNISMIVHDSAGSTSIAMLDHDTRKVMYPSRLMEELQELMASLPEQPRMTFRVSSVTLDSLGAGETISGFTTKRFRLRADISVAMELMGETMEQTMHMETEGDYAEELSDFIDPLQGSRTFQAFTAGMPFMDSSATAELGKIGAIMPRGLPLRQRDRMTGVSEGGEAVQGSVTVLSNIKRGTFGLSIFSIPEDYTEMEMPMTPPMN